MKKINWSFDDIMAFILLLMVVVFIVLAETM